MYDSLSPRSARLYACDCAEYVAADLGTPAADVIAKARGFAEGDVSTAGLDVARAVAKRVHRTALAACARTGSSQARAKAFAAEAVLACVARRPAMAATKATAASARSRAYATGDPISHEWQSKWLLGYL